MLELLIGVEGSKTAEGVGTAPNLRVMFVDVLTVQNCCAPVKNAQNCAELRGTAQNCAGAIWGTLANLYNDDSTM